VETKRVRRRHYQLAFVVIATLLLFILVMLPFTVASVVTDVFGPPVGRVHPLSPGPEPAPAASHARLNIAFVALDEPQALLTLRVTGYRLCEGPCAWTERLVFFAVPPEDYDGDGLPPSAVVILPNSTGEVNESVQLPVQGQPTRYPFDTYDLRLGIAVERAPTDGTLKAATQAEVASTLFLSVQEQLVRQTMLPPRAVAPSDVRAPNVRYTYLYVYDLRFQRPVYLQVLAVLLTLLVTAAAAYAVFMRPLSELVVNSGALVLGVWGVRQILVPVNNAFVTAVDLSLSVVILFLLGAITVRALLFVHERSGLELHRWLGARRGKPPAQDPG